MNVADDHSRWNDDLAAYAIGALDAHDMAAFAKHLTECDTCRAELHRLAPAIDLLPGAVEQLEPPPDLRMRIMAEVEGDLASEAALAGTPARPATRKRRRWDWRPALALGGVTAVAAAFGIGVLVSGDDSATAPTTVPVQALAPASAEQVRGSLVEDGGRWRLAVDRLPALQGDRVYQAWTMRGRTIEPSTVFVLSQDGTASVEIPASLASGDRVLVTSEPRGGSSQPTSRPLLAAEV